MMSVTANHQEHDLCFQTLIGHRVFRGRRQVRLPQRLRRLQFADVIAVVDVVATR